MSTGKKIKMRPPTEGHRACVSPKSTFFYPKTVFVRDYTPNPENTNYSYPLIVRYIYA